MMVDFLSPPQKPFDIKGNVRLKTIKGEIHAQFHQHLCCFKFARYTPVKNMSLTEIASEMLEACAYFDCPVFFALKHTKNGSVTRYKTTQTQAMNFFWGKKENPENFIELGSATKSAMDYFKREAKDFIEPPSFVRVGKKTLPLRQLNR